MPLFDDLRIPPTQVAMTGTSQAIASSATKKNDSNTLESSDYVRHLMGLAHIILFPHEGSVVSHS
jgi:hypothetical protein